MVGGLELGRVTESHRAHRARLEGLGTWGLDAQSKSKQGRVAQWSALSSMREALGPDPARGDKRPSSHHVSCGWAPPRGAAGKPGRLSAWGRLWAAGGVQGGGNGTGEEFRAESSFKQTNKQSGKECRMRGMWPPCSARATASSSCLGCRDGSQEGKSRRVEGHRPLSRLSLPHTSFLSWR